MRKRVCRCGHGKVNHLFDKFNPGCWATNKASGKLIKAGKWKGYTQFKICTCLKYHQEAS